jgi:hypothetical protein
MATPVEIEKRHFLKTTASIAVIAGGLILPSSFATAREKEKIPKRRRLPRRRI